MVWYIIKLFNSWNNCNYFGSVQAPPLLGSLIASLPLVSVLGMIWIYGETKDLIRIADHAEGTFWYVLPSLPMFLLMPFLLRKGISFSCIICRDCPYGCTLFCDDQGFSKIWNELIVPIRTTDE